MPIITLTESKDNMKINLFKLVVSKILKVLFFLYSIKGAVVP